MNWKATLVVASLLAACSGDDDPGKPEQDAGSNNNQPDAALDMSQSDAAVDDMTMSDQGMASGFEAFKFATNAKFQMVHAITSDLAYIGTNDGLYRFEDGQILPTSNRNIDVKDIDARSPTDVWVAGTMDGNAVIRKFDGESWADFDFAEFGINPGETFEEISLGTSGAFFASDGNQVYRYSPTALLGGPNMYGVHSANAEDPGQLHAFQDDESLWVTTWAFLMRYDGNTGRVSTTRWDPFTGLSNVEAIQLTFNLTSIDGDDTDFWLGGGTSQKGVLVQTTGTAGTQFENFLIGPITEVAAAGDTAWWVTVDGEFGSYFATNWAHANVNDTIIDVDAADGATFGLSEDTLWRCQDDGCQDTTPIEVPDAPQIRYALAFDNVDTNVCYDDVVQEGLELARGPNSALTSTPWATVQRDDLFTIESGRPSDNCGNTRYVYPSTYTPTPGTKTTAVIRPAGDMTANPLFRVSLVDTDTDRPAAGMARVQLINAMFRVNGSQEGSIDLCKASTTIVADLDNMTTMTQTVDMAAGSHLIQVRVAGNCAQTSLGGGSISLQADKKYVVILENTQVFLNDAVAQVCEESPDGSLSCTRVALTP